MTLIAPTLQAFFTDRLTRQLQGVRTVAVICASLMGFLFYGTLCMMSLVFQQLRGWTPGATGVAPASPDGRHAGRAVLICRRLSRRFGHPVLLVVGFVCCALGIAVLARTDAHTAYALIAFGLLLIGVASTVSFSALTSLLLASVSEEQAGLASRVQNTTRQAGALMSVSILGAVLNAHAIGPGSLGRSAFSSSVVLLAIGVASLSLGGGHRARADRGTLTPLRGHEPL